MSDDLDLDYTKIDIPEYPKPRIFSAELAQLDFAKLRVMGKLKKKSQGALAQTALYTYIIRNWPEDCKRLCVEAKQKGVTPEEYFQQLLNDD
jgi:hypothetical protein